MSNLAKARQKALAKQRLAALPVPKLDTLLKIEQEGREDWEHEGSAAMNPYMGAEGDAWARGYWAAASK